jgi:glycosyltransferase involved in cell wall biosynthesis
VNGPAPSRVAVALHAGQLLQPVPGGVGRYVRALVRHLPRAGVDVTAFAAGPKPANLTDPVAWTDLGWPRGSLRYELWHRLRAPAVRAPGDVVHAPSLAMPPPGDRPLVATVHDIAFLRFPEVTTPRGLRFHRRGLELARRATVVAAPSAFTRDELLREGFDPQRVHVVPLGVDPPQPREHEQVDAVLHALAVDSPFVLTVGTVEPRKNVSTLIEAVQMLRRTRPDVVLLVVGPPGWGTVAGLDRPGVRRLGRLPWVAVDALYRRASVCALVSHYEGFGLPALEALARGTPLVCSEGSALGEVVGGAALRVAPGDPAAIADALRRALEDETLRTDARVRGPARAREFTWQRSAQRHAQLYATAIGGDRVTRS